VLAGVSQGDPGIGAQGSENEALVNTPQGPATKLLGGKDVIYTGKGNYVRDNADKYPTKDGLSGGFAGGERGVEAYVSDGEVSFDEDNPAQVRAGGVVHGALDRWHGWRTARLRCGGALEVFVLLGRYAVRMVNVSRARILLRSSVPSCFVSRIAWQALCNTSAD
jgi:hypothetical protein